MKTNFTKLTLIGLLSAAGSTLAFAESNWAISDSPATSAATATAPKASALTAGFANTDVKQVLNLKDGSSVYIFKDGKMGMETRTGRAHRMVPGTVMETADGQKILMRGDEVARVDSVLYRIYGRGN